MPEPIGEPTPQFGESEKKPEKSFRDHWKEYFEWKESYDKRTKEQEIRTREQEIRDSDVFARQKLEKLLDENFKDFGRRFMNIGEYEQIMRSGSLQARECNIEEDDRWRPSFRSWLEEAKYYGWYADRGLSRGMMKETDFGELSGKAFLSYYILLGELREAHEEANREKKNNPQLEKSVRDLTIEKFIEARKGFHSRGPDYFGGDVPRRVDRWRDRIEAEKDELRKSVGDENYDYIMARIKNIDPEKRWLEPHEIWIDCEKRGIEISEWALKHIIEEEARVKQAEQVKQLNREDLELLEKLEKNPELLKEGNNLRRLFSILPYTEDIEGHMYGAGEGGLHFQYEVVLILNSNAVSNKKGDWIWRVLKPGEMKGDELLGVVVIMPDRKMVERVVGLSAKAGKFSHPVFTSRGNVAYPKPEKQDSGPEKSESPKREKKPSRTKRKKK